MTTSQNRVMKVGTAWQDITPNEPIALGGQMHVRLGEYKRDPLTVNAVVFDDGQAPIAIVSCDVCMVTEEHAALIKHRCAESCGIAPDRVLIAATHTHVAPLTWEHLAGEVKPWFLDNLTNAAVLTVTTALKEAEDAQLYAGQGYIEHMGWNRRGLRTDGTAGMYWGSWREGFAGIEGPRDGTVPVIFAKRPDGSVKAVVCSFASHPNCIESAKCYSADFPGEVRRVIRQTLGENVGVVYLTGAAGDTAPSIMVNNPGNIQPWRGEEGVKRSGIYLGGEILKVIAESGITPMADQSMAMEHVKMPTAIRPWPDSFDPTKLSPGMREFFVHSRECWPDLLAKSPMDIAISVVRLGNAVICTNPGELYCQYGLAIRQVSPARVTLIAELVDGWAGYLPSPDAITRGGYSAEPGLQCKFVPEAAPMLVNKTIELLARLFKG